MASAEIKIRRSWAAPAPRTSVYLRCGKCNRYIEAATRAEAVEKWNAPAAAETSIDGGRVSCEIY